MTGLLQTCIKFNPSFFDSHKLNHRIVLHLLSAMGAAIKKRVIGSIFCLKANWKDRVNEFQHVALGVNGDYMGNEKLAGSGQLLA